MEEETNDVQDVREFSEVTQGVYKEFINVRDDSRGIGFTLGTNTLSFKELCEYLLALKEKFNDAIKKETKYT